MICSLELAVRADRRMHVDDRAQVVPNENHVHARVRTGTALVRGERLSVRLLDRERDRHRLAAAAPARTARSSRACTSARPRSSAPSASTSPSRSPASDHGAREQTQRGAIFISGLPLVGVRTASTTAAAPPRNAIAVASRASDAGSDEITTPCQNTLSEPRASAAATTPTTIAAHVRSERSPSSSASAASTASNAADPTSIHCARLAIASPVAKAVVAASAAAAATPATAAASLRPAARRCVRERRERCRARRSRRRATARPAVSRRA